MDGGPYLLMRQRVGRTTVRYPLLLRMRVYRRPDLLVGVVGLLVSWVGIHHGRAPKALLVLVQRDLIVEVHLGMGHLLVLVVDAWSGEVDLARHGGLVRVDEVPMCRGGPLRQVGSLSMRGKHRLAR